MLKSIYIATNYASKASLLIFTIRPLFLGELRGCNGVNLSAIEPVETVTCSALGTSQVSKDPLDSGSGMRDDLVK